MEFLQAIPWEQIVIQTVNGIVTGMILALIASGLTLIFGIMDVVNFAHGELFMLGAYMGVVVFATSGSFWLALVLAVMIVALIGAAMQITMLRPLVGRDPLTTILATFGISLILQNYALWQFGPVPRKIHEPISGHFNLFYLEYPYYRILIAFLSAAIIGAFWMFLKYGKYGIWIRATTQDRVMAQAMGIPGAAGAHRGLRHRRGDGGGERRAVRSAGRRQSRHGPRLGAEGLHRRRGRRHGQSRRRDRGGDLHQPARSLCLAGGEPGAGGDRVLRRADLHPSVPAHGPLCADAQMSTQHTPDNTAPVASTASSWATSSGGPTPGGMRSTSGPASGPSSRCWSWRRWCCRRSGSGFSPRS
jgi:hypothetical protein